MTIEDFRRLDASYRAAKPNLFKLATPDKCTSVEQVADVERKVGVTFPASYRNFLYEFGGGAFGLLTVYSADPEGEWFLPTRLQGIRSSLPTELIPIADDFAGGYYVLRILDGSAVEPVYYWSPDDGLISTEFNNVLDFIARYAYEPA